MMRFSLAILFAVLVAASRPVATGGRHDFLAVGVVVETPGGGGERTASTILSAPTGEMIAVYDALLRTEARTALLQGFTVHAGPLPAAEGEAGEGPRIRELVFYGIRTRAGRAAVAFDGESTLASTTGAAEAARTLAAMPPPVTAAAAAVLLETRDLAALEDALRALAATRADVAAAEALSLARDRSLDFEHRLLAIRILRDPALGLGGEKQYPAAFADLRADPDPTVAEAAK